MNTHELNDLVDRQHERIGELETERDALAAQWEKVRGYLVGYSQLLREKAATFGGYTEADISHRSNYCREAHDVDEAYGSIPVTSLARLKAEAEQAFADWAEHDLTQDGLFINFEKLLERYRRQAEGRHP